MLTNSDLKQILDALARYGKKDSQLDAVPIDLEHPEGTFTINDYLSIVQDGKNKTIKIKNLEKVFLLTFLTDEDFREALKGRIPGEMLENASVTTEKLADGSITTIKLGDSSVTNTKLSDNAVTSSKLADNSVTTSKIVDESVTTSKLNTNAVTTNKLADGSVTTDKIANGAVTSSKIADNSLSGANFGNNTIEGTKIKDNSIPGSKLADGAIESIDIKDGTLSGSKLADNSVTGAKLQDSVITGMKIADNSIPGSKIADSTIQNLNIANGSISGSKLVDNAITTDKVANGAINSVKLANDAITENKIADNSVTTNKIADRAVTNNKLANNSVTSDKIADNSITSNMITDYAVTENKLDNGSVTASKIAPNAVTATKLGDNTITSDKIVDGSVTAQKLADESVTTDKIDTDAVTNVKIADNSVTESKIATNAVTTAKIADGNVTTVKIADNTVTTIKLADGAVTEDKLADGAVTTAKLADGLISEIQNITDATPTAGSVKPVQSGGVKTAIDNVAFSTNEKVKDIGIDDEPTAGSDNLVKSGGVYETMATFDDRVTENTQNIKGAEGVLQNTTYYENIIDYNPTFGAVNANTGEVISSSTAKIAIIKIEDWADQIIYRSLITASSPEPRVYGGAFYTAATPEEFGTDTFLSGVLYNRKSVAGSEIRTIDIPEGATYFATGCQTTNTLLNKDNFFIVQTTKSIYSQDITNNTYTQYSQVGVASDTHTMTTISGNNWVFVMMYEINDTYKNITLSGFMPSAAYEGITCWSAPDPTNAENYLGNMDGGITKSRVFDNVTIKYTDLPKGTKYIIVHQASSATPKFVVSGPQMPIVNNIITATVPTQSPVAGEDIKKNVIELTPDSIDRYKMLFSDGTTPNAASYTKNPYITTYNNIDPTLDYYACGVSSRFYDASSNAKMVMVAYYDENNEVIASEKATETITQTGTDAAVDYKLHVPPQTTTIKVYGDARQLPCLKLFNNNSDAKKYDAIIAPQIHNNLIYRKDLSTPLKMLCVGSSWFMNTWWYTNKIIASAGINAEIHTYYMGSSEFKEWVQLYNNDLSPITSSRGCRRHVSVNGADWTINIKGSNNYTPQNFRDDFYADMTAGDWDLIVIQQGAKTCQCWADWQYYKDWLYIIKQNCNPDTVIGFNSTWTPALGHRYLTDNQPNTYEGQNEWQRINYDHTQKFMKLSGIDLVIPNGALLRILRASSDINIAEQNDLADDKLHLNNGLPEYAVAGNFFQTLIAPMYGVDFDTVEWVPTTSTQKSTVAGNSYYPMTDEQRTLVHKAIKMSQADRFGFRTFE